MKAQIPAKLDRPSIRFILAGSFNTLLTGAMLSVLSLWLPGAVAYSLVFAFGIVLSAVLAGRFVFRARMGWRRVLAYVVMYLVVYLAGLGVVHAFRIAGLPPAINGLVVFVTAPMTFLGARWIFRADEEPQSDD